jgi:hypothetical protein
MSWIVETQLDTRSPWQLYARTLSRKLAGILASYPRAGGYRTRVKPSAGGGLNFVLSLPQLPKEQPMKAAAGNPVERAFESFVALTPTEQLEFRAMLKGRDFAAPPAQMTLTDKQNPPRAPKARKEKAQPAAETSASSASV